MAAIVLQVVNVAQLGDLSAALRLGADAKARSFVEAELGDVPLTGGTGHDGYQFFVIARDPLALDAANRSIYFGYRHRRVLYPALAGLGGVLPPRITLYGLAVWSAVGIGLAAGATAAVARLLGAARWAPIGAVANVGLLSSVQLLTADSLAIGLGLAAIAATARRRHVWATILLVAAVLTKETSILFALGASAWTMRANWRAAATMLAAPTLAIVAWSAYINGLLGDGFSTQRNLGAPLVGLVRSVELWTEPAVAVLGGVALGGLVVALAGCWLARSQLLWAVTVPWLVVALLSSTVVWEDGNNAMRIFAMLWILGILGIGVRAGALAGAKPHEGAPTGSPAGPMPTV